MGQRVRSEQRPEGPDLIFDPDDEQKQQEDHGTHGIAEDADPGARGGIDDLYFQKIRQTVLKDCRDRQHDDDQHHLAMRAADIRVDDDRERQADQEEKKRGKRGCGADFDIRHRSVLLSSGGNARSRDGVFHTGMKDSACRISSIIFDIQALCKRKRRIGRDPAVFPSPRDT